MKLSYTAFFKGQIVASGKLPEVVLDVKKNHKKLGNYQQVLFFNDQQGTQIDFDLRGSEKDILSRLSLFTEEKTITNSRSRGRPRLGVVSREISLLPKHWEWLNSQKGGASVTLRNLVEKAIKTEPQKQSIKKAQERCHNVMTALAGDLENYEEALRALYKKNFDQFFEYIECWPKDIKHYIIKIAEDAFK